MFPQFESFAQVPLYPLQDASLSFSADIARYGTHIMPNIYEEPGQARAYLLILANEHRPRLVFSLPGMRVPSANHKKILMAHRRFSMIIFIVLPRFVGDLL